MEKFRITIKRRLIWAILYNTLIVIFVSGGYFIGDWLNETENFGIGFSSGFFVGIQCVMLFYMNKYRKALKNEEKLKELYIIETDERSRYIQSQIGGIGINIILCGIILGTLVASFINWTIFMTLIITLFFAVLVKAALKFYYHKKI